MSSPYRKMNLTYSPRVEENEKDLIISQLKAQVFELEQNEKNFNAVSHKARALQNETDLLSNEKLRLEYEIKQRSETSDKQIYDLRQNNENLQLELSEKIQVNKKLFADNNSLFRLKESLSGEINELKLQINNLIDENASLRGRGNQLEGALNNEKNGNALLRNQNENLQREFEKSNRTVSDLNEILKNTQNDKNTTNIKLEESKRDNANLSAQLNRKEENLKFASKQIDDLNSTCQLLKGKLLEAERASLQQKAEFMQLSNAFNAEKGLRNSLEKSTEQLETLLNEKDKENRKMYADNSELRSQCERSNVDNKIIGNEMEKLKSHILILTEQNQTVSF
jgi:chromosome segregation ATPase